jgi:glucan phosphoethanolaminetransferase (alkaline phosphatase superfamily)
MQKAKNVDLSFEETSVVSVFNKLHFDTSLIGSQSIHRYLRSRPESSNFYDDFHFTLFPSGGVSMSMKLRPYDEDLFPYIDGLLDSKNKKNRFIVVHTAGSHWDYDSKYTKEFEKFTPTCASENTATDQASCKISSLVNSYDNTILYTDYIISEIIKKFKNKYAIIIYTSDHGESLGEDGRLAHGGEFAAREQVEVPFFVWASDKYIQKNKEKFENIKSKLGKELSHDYIFHSLLDCANIESEAINKNLSICSPNRQSSPN